MNETCVNIACGDSFLEEWCNLDYAPYSSTVTKANLLRRLPLADGSAGVVYSSHFLEHIPRNKVSSFLAECFRITKSGGRLRLVLPDLQEMCSMYLGCRQRGEHDRADFLVLEMIDQCVRTVSGGELGAYFSRLHAQDNSNSDMMEFVRRRTGYGIQSAAINSSGNRVAKIQNSFVAKLEQLYCRTVLKLLPSAFRQQNVSFAEVGERHAWVYDFYSVEKLLNHVGYVDVRRMTASTSSIQNFPHFPLDVTEEGRPRKGAESMYIEAVRP